MQTPAILRENLIKWRIGQIKEQFQKRDQHPKLDWEKLQLEHDFLMTLSFYGGIKEKILTPLLNMQVRELEKLIKRLKYRI